jgi:hypothetical protein
MSQVGEPQRIIIAEPLYEPVPQVPQEQPLKPVQEPEPEPEKVPA